MASAAIAAPTSNSPVQQLTCGQNPQGLMCNVDKSSNIQSTSQIDVADSRSFAPAAITTKQLAQLSDLTIGLMYFGLPCSLIFAVLLHERRKAQQAQLVARLERIWIKSRD